MDRRKFVSYKTSKDFRERFISPFVLYGNRFTYYDW